MIRKVLRYLSLLAVPLCITFFTGYYLTSSYEELRSFFTGLNDSFYRSEHWRTFFTNDIRNAGIYWCAAALPLSWVWFFLVRNLKLLPAGPYFPHRQRNYLILGTGGLIAATVMYMHAPPAADEVFSALNFASLPALQCAAYYPIPNNHIFYNLISGLVSPLFDELLLGPRLLSMLAYILTLFAVYGWLKKFVSNEVAVWSGLILLAFQFSFWGFSAQGRGYALMTLCSVMSLKSLLTYMQAGDTGQLGVYMCTLACGMFIIPSFLIWGAGMTVLILLRFIQQKRADVQLLKYSLAGWLLAFLFYVPLLGFSGLGSLTDNPYVRGFEGSHLDFIPVFFGNYGYFSGLYQEWFTVGIGGAFVLLFLPLLSGLIRKPDSGYTFLMLVYISFAAGFILISLLLKNMAFYRNLSAHALMVHFVVVVSVFRLLTKKWMTALISLGFLFYAGVEAGKNYDRVHSCLYYYDVRSTRSEMQDCLPYVSADDDVFIDNEAFYAWTLFNENDRQVRPALNRKNFRGQEICILHRSENFLKDSAGYIMTDTCTDYLIYRRNELRLNPVR